MALKGLTARQMQPFDAVQMKWVTANTVIRYYTLLPQALKYAVRTDFIPVNSMDKVYWSSKNSFQLDSLTGLKSTGCAPP